MFGRRPAEPPPPVVPWQGGAVRAEVAQLPAGGRRHVPSVVLAVAGTAVQLHAAEVRDLARGRLGIAESAVPPLAFLCRAGAAAPGGQVHDVVGHLPAEALALVVVVDRRSTVAAVLDGALLESFTSWGEALPG